MHYWLKRDGCLCPYARTSSLIISLLFSHHVAVSGAVPFSHHVFNYISYCIQFTVVFCIVITPLSLSIHSSSLCLLCSIYPSSSLSYSPHLCLFLFFYYSYHSFSLVVYYFTRIRQNLPRTQLTSNQVHQPTMNRSSFKVSSHQFKIHHCVLS